MPLGTKRADYNDARYAGAEVEAGGDAVAALDFALGAGFDFVLAPLGLVDERRAACAVGADGTAPAPWAGSDLALTAGQWSSQVRRGRRARSAARGGGRHRQTLSQQVVGRVSSWIDPDAADAPLAADSVAALAQELAWAAHLSLQAVIVPIPPSGLGPRTARAINQAVRGLASTAVWLRLPAEGPTDSWVNWARLRTLCEHGGAKLGVMLELPEAAPPANSPPLLDRWLGEPLKAVALPAAAFVPNRKGHPVLPAWHQATIEAALSACVQVVLAGEPTLAPPADAGAPTQPPPEAAAKAAWEYLAFLYRRAPEPGADAAAELGYRDYLQAPLQPLQDDLESATYETFERDAAKYDGYRAAVEACLAARVAAARLADPSAPPPTTVLMVVGAGRGPLVRASLAAADAAGAPVRVYAVEKNPNAVVTLQHAAAGERAWLGRVTVVAADMRAWTPPELADVVVSELLGSFGDNELSPECLDGAARLCKDGAVSIPADYTSFLQPVAAAKLWADVKAQAKDFDEGGAPPLKALETPYVVKLHRVTPLAPTVPVFSFAHPRPGAGAPGDDAAAANARFITLTFDRANEPAATLHGFAGFFETTLFAPVTLSTHPPTHTPGMASWFPIFFPLVSPVDVGAGEGVAVHVWRCAAPGRVWYEWAAEVGGGASPRVTTPIHNPGGRSYYVGL